MRVDAPGLVAAAQRLIVAMEGLSGSEVPHPPLAADPASMVAGERLTTAGAELTAALVAHVSALLASIEFLTGAAFTFTATDEANAVLAAFGQGVAAAAAGPGLAAPVPPIPPDLRVPMPPPAGMPAPVISAAIHAGAPGGGEPFIASWHEVALAARSAAEALRSAMADLPEVLDAPVSTPAVSAHFVKFASGLDTYAERGATLARQAQTYESNLVQARAAIPTPQQLTTAETNVRTIQAANVASGGRHAVPLAKAVKYRNQLHEQTVSNYSPYHSRTDAATAGNDPGDGSDQGAEGSVPGDPNSEGQGAAGPNAADPSATGLTQGGGDQMAQMVPQLMQSMVGAVGGALGAGMGAVTQVPQALMGAMGSAVGAATGAMSGLGKSNAEPPGGGNPDAGGDPGKEGGGGGGAPTTPAGGEGLPVAAATGGPPTPAIAPVGAAEAADHAGGAGGGGGMAGGMPMGALGGAPGGGGGEGKGEAGRKRKVVVQDIPHTEDVTGRVDTNRLSAAAANVARERGPGPPNEDNSPDAGAPVVRRLVTRKREDPS
jgi:hypothetical protein